MFTGKIVRSGRLFRLRPETLPGFRCLGDEFLTVFIAESALKTIAESATKAMPTETIGYLCGRPFRDEQGTWIVVAGAVEAQGARRTAASVETTLVDERELVRELTSEFPTAEKIGWWHSHPFDSPSYSHVDLDSQRLWQEPYHLGLLACVVGGDVTIHAFAGPESRRMGRTFRVLPQQRSLMNYPAFRAGEMHAPIIAEKAFDEAEPAPRPNRPETCPSGDLAAKGAALGIDGTGSTIAGLLGAGLIATAVFAGAHTISAAIQKIDGRRVGEPSAMAPVEKK